MRHRRLPGILTLLGLTLVTAPVVAQAHAPTVGRTAAGQSATTQAAAAIPPYAVNRDGTRTAASVAIRNVCAWPNLVLLTDGTIAAFVFNQPSHGRMIGGVDCYASTDAGRTWQKRAAAAAPDLGGEHNRMNHAAGLAANGNLVVITGGWTLEPKPHDHGPFTLDELIRPCVSRSTDGGRTWAVDKNAFPATAPNGQTFVPFGSIVKAKDGTLRVSAYVVDGKTYVLRSDDDGRTWTDPVWIETEMKPNETTLWSDGTGRIVAAARAKALEIFESTDDGQSWRHLSRASDDLGIPGDLRLLADGRLLVTHGNRRKGAEGVDARVSDDGGRTWSDPRRLADFIGFDGGYPSSVQLPDGTVVTAYYARKTPDHNGYHMGVIAWDPARTFPQDHRPR